VNNHKGNDTMNGFVWMLSNLIWRRSCCSDFRTNRTRRRWAVKIVLSWIRFGRRWKPWQISS